MSVTVIVKVKKQTECRGGFNVKTLREKEWEDRLLLSLLTLRHSLKVRFFLLVSLT